MIIHRALASTSLLVLGGALCLTSSNTRAQTALPPVTVDAPRTAPAKPVARRPSVRATARVRARPNVIVATRATAQPALTTPSEARANLFQAPNGQIQTTIDRSQFDNRPSFSVGDVLRDSPGISVKQGNGP